MNILVGFDGFVDEILSLVDKRTTPDHYDTIPTIHQFSKRIDEASGKSCNIEWISRSMTLGGNAPLLATGLLEQDATVTFIGACGENPLFDSLKNRCDRFYSIAEPGYTHAVEFQDGKIFFGKTASLESITPEKIKEKIGKEPFFELFHNLDAFACVNWTMIPHMNRIFDWICLNMPPLPKKPLCLIDLCDPRKRTTQDLHAALHLLKHLQRIFDVVLSFNQSEGEQIAQALEISNYDLNTITTKIQSTLHISMALLHTKTVCAVSNNERTVLSPVQLILNPKRLTGAGDHFNAGFIIEYLRSHDIEKALKHAIATAQFLIRNGQSPKTTDI